MKKFWEEFKAFALKGNVMDMAVGVIMASAFGTVVSSLTDNIINPIIGLLFQLDFSSVAIKMGSVDLKIGAFISSVINFLLMALVLFIMVKAVNKAVNLHPKKEEEPAEPAKSPELLELEKITALLEKQNENK
ncbi:MAG: large conductance mechanosensitive channel protein MscL [Lactimicrobium sp.]|jgi:large conductance mechanosensitive channel|uniref:large conductance mechanosensitive channel protein MscL n=1 Tax=Lactimicrobium sp. TaxID=2563780 RepID=UPI002F355E70